MGYEIDAKRGVANHYGPREVNMANGGQLPSNGLVKQVVWEFGYDNLPTPGTNNLQWNVPANAKVVAAKLYVDTAWVSTSGTTDLTVGLQKADGTEIDNDGLVTAAEATDAALGAEGVVVGAGALVNAAIGADAGELVVAASAADFTAGHAKVVVEYVLDK